MSSELIEGFCQVTGADEGTALSFLSACNNNLDMAVSLFMDEGAAAPNASNGSYRSPIPQRNEQLLPVELPIYASHFNRAATTAPSYRTRRRAFVADDSDDDDPDALTLGASSLPTNEHRQRETSSLRPPVATAPSNSTETTQTTFHPAVNGSHESVGKKRSHLRQLYQPPVEIMFQGSLSAAKSAAQERNQWLLVSLHDESCFDCHLMNRDVWKDPRVYQTVKKHFTFLQIAIDSPEGLRFRSRYSYVSAASHIAVLDPNTGEQKVMWMHLKDPGTVDEVLTEFLRYNKFPTASSSSVAGTRRAASTDLDATMSTLHSIKRPRMEPSVGENSGLLSRVAAVTSQIADSGTDSSASVAHSSTKLNSTSSPLDLTEEEQLQLAIEASKIENSVSSQPTKSSFVVKEPNECPPFKPSQSSADTDTDLIVLTDDENDSSENESADPDCFIFDPKLMPRTAVSTTALISARRPLRPTAESYSKASINAVADSTTPVSSSTTHNTPFPLPVPESEEAVMELVVRLPSGEREILRLSPQLQLQILRKHYDSRGFHHSRYELVRLYPRTSLSTLSDTTALCEAGFSKKDTLFLQEI